MVVVAATEIRWDAIKFLGALEIGLDLPAGPYLIELPAAERRGKTNTRAVDSHQHLAGFDVVAYRQTTCDTDPIPLRPEPPVFREQRTLACAGTHEVVR